MRNAERHVLYRMFDADGDLLYIGITNNPPERFRAHSGGKDWWPQVSNITVETFSSREELESAEWAAIGAESPRYNVRRPVDAARCITCGSPSPNLMPQDGEVVLYPPTGEWMPFCTDPFHFPNAPEQASHVHGHVDYLRGIGAIRLSEEAEPRWSRHRKAMEMVAEALLPTRVSAKAEAS